MHELIDQIEDLLRRDNARRHLEAMRSPAHAGRLEAGGPSHHALLPLNGGL